MYYCLVLLAMLLPVCSGNYSPPNSQQNTMFDIVYDFMQGKGESLLRFEDFLPVEAGMDFFELIDLFDDPVGYNDTRPICQTCLNFMRVTKSVAAVYEWEEVRDVIVEGCKWLMFNNSDGYLKVDVLCPGIIDNQGPHVYETAKPKYRKSPRDLCEHLNACLLPKPSKSGQLSDTIVPYMAEGGGSPLSLEDRKKAALKVVQMADIHIEPDYAEGSSTDCGLFVCCDDAYGPGDAGAYGSYNCNIPQRTMELFLKKAAQINPDFIIYSGDTPPHVLWDESLHSQLNCTAILTQAMSRILGNYTIYTSLGNHEMYPTNLYSMNFLANYTPYMNEEFVSMWDPFINFTAESVANMLEGGYYSQVIRPGLRILSINANYWYAYNFYNVLNKDEIESMFAFMEESLEQARDQGEKVVFVSHHPPGNGDAIVQYTRVFEDLLATYGDLIVLHVSGHTHNDHYKVHSNVEGEVSNVMFINPSVTTKTNVNPSMRVYYIDETTFELIDFEQHGFILEDVIALQKQNSSEPEIELWYNAMTEYELTDMSAASWRDLSDRMLIDDELFMKYYTNHVNRFGNPSCDDGCRHNQICSTLYYSYDDYVYCTEGYFGPTTAGPAVTDPPTSTSARNGLSVMVVSVLMAVMAVMAVLM